MNSLGADEDGCRTVSAVCNDEQERIGALVTINILGLNACDELDCKLKGTWDRSLRRIQHYVSVKMSSGWQTLKLLGPALAARKLNSLGFYGAEFSSLAETCIEKEAPLAL